MTPCLVMPSFSNKVCSNSCLIFTRLAPLTVISELCNEVYISDIISFISFLPLYCDHTCIVNVCSVASLSCVPISVAVSSPITMYGYAVPSGTSSNTFDVIWKKCKIDFNLFFNLKHSLLYNYINRP